MFVSIFILFIITLLYSYTFVKIPYIYLILGIIFAVIPVMFVIYKFPNLLTRFIEITVYFSLFSFAWEIIALKLHQWEFPGHYFIGWIKVFGVQFPFEEFLV